MTGTPAGWHPAPDRPGQLRYWDGVQWTDHYAPMQMAAPPPVAAPPKRRRINRIILTVTAGIVGLIVLIVIISAATSSNKSSDTASSSDDSTSSTSTSDDSSSTPSSPRASASKAPSYTVAQANAIKSAQQYLSLGGGFSRAGLITQLSSKNGEGFKQADAVFAVNHIKVDYNQQAVLSAKAYLSMGGFSRAGLIEQLSSKAGDGYTKAQATYAADHVGL